MILFLLLNRKITILNLKVKMNLITKVLEWKRSDTVERKDFLDSYIQLF